MIDPVMISNALTMANDVNNLVKNVSPETKRTIVNTIEVLCPPLKRFNDKQRQRGQEKAFEDSKFQLASAGDKETLEKVELAMQEYFPHLKKEAGNKEAVAGETLKSLVEKVKENPEALKNIQEPDPDWLSQFSDYSRNASKEYTQKLWGKILAGEMTKAGSVSKKTLRVLNDLDTETAIIFNNLAKHMGRDGWVYFSRDDNIFKLQKLVEAGLLYNLSGELRPKLSFQGTGKQHTTNISKDFVVDVELPDEKNNVLEEIWPIFLTQSGQEIKRHLLGEDTLEINSAARFIAGRYFTLGQFSGSSIRIFPLIIEKNKSKILSEKEILIKDESRSFEFKIQ